ncbi:signal peptidase I [Microbacterium sp. G2-8]|uniref:signal peptidase I n=1 Tax=Microbacterium sp. G2-8 TaxID=2842454 RepID=UPI001C89CCAE|nr:signal peptidase I [Microbacterium sp. G2-8]
MALTIASTPPRTAPRLERVLRGTGDALLWVAASVGALCIVLAVLTSVLGFRVMLFSSGSMEPTIATGSAALVAPVDAPDVEVGDVVTVDRAAGELPVTHRVVEVAPAGSADARLLTLRGDANAVNDPAPYEVTEVGRVVFSVPGVAPVLAGLGDPKVLAPLGAVAAAFVIWGLWPRSKKDRP